MLSGVLLALLCAFGWGWSYVFVRRGQRAARVSIDAGLFLTVLTNNAFNLVVVAVAWAAGLPLRPGWLAVLWFALAGICTTFLGRVVVYRSVALIGPSRADALKVAQPIFTAVLAAIFLGEVLGARILIGMALVLGGAAALARESHGPGAIPADRHRWRLGLVLGLSGAFLYGSGNVLRKAGVNAYASAIAGVAISAFAALLLITAMLLAQGRAKEMHAALRRPDREYVLAGAFNSVGLYGFFGSVTLLPVAVTTVIASVEPFFTALASRVALGRREERLSGRFFGAAALIALGVAVIAVGL